MLIGAAISAGTAIANTVIGVRNANKKAKMAKQLASQGESLESQAWANRKDYAAPEATQKQYNRTLNALSGKSSVQSAMESQADIGVSNILGAGGRNATSQSGGLAAAMAAEQQRQSGYTNAAVAGAGENNQKEARFANASRDMAEAEDQAYNLNVQQKFDLNYGKSQDMISSGFQGKLDTMDQKSQAWASGISAMGKMAGAAADSGMFGGKTEGLGVDTNKGEAEAIPAQSGLGKIASFIKNKSSVSSVMSKAEARKVLSDPRTSSDKKLRDRAVKSFYGK